MLKSIERQALGIIRSHYRDNGKIPTLRSLAESLWYKSPRSAMLLVDQLIEKGYLVKSSDGDILLGKEELIWSTTVDVPLVGTVACWQPIFAVENIEAKIPVSTNIATWPYKYFFLRAKWNSMNEIGINHGDLILVREQHTAKDGDIIVALIDDEATVKELRIFDDYVALVPHSTEEKHKPIILHEDFLVQWLVIKSFPNSIF